MPRLREYVHRPGCFYIVGRLPGLGFCTWQLNAAGRRSLAAIGRGSDGDYIPLDELRCQIGRGDARAGGGGPTPADPVGFAGGGALVVALEGWAAAGGSEAGLAAILRPPAHDHRDRCYSRFFLAWLAGLDPDVPLARLDGLTATGFEELAAWHLRDFGPDTLHELLAFRGSVGVLWRLARVVGPVAREVAAGGGCPAGWADDPVRCHLFAAVRKLQDAPVRDASTACIRLRQAPRIEWQVELHEVVATFPGQGLPDAAEAVTWAVDGGPPVCPTVTRDGVRRVAADARSAPLRPAAEYAVEARFQPVDKVDTCRWSFAADEALVLFGRDEVLVTADEPIPPGEYLALCRGDATPPGAAWAAARPDGWAGWRGWRVRLAAGAVGPYTVADVGPAGWKLDEPPAPGVWWLAPIPVYLGDLPRVAVSPAGAFAGAVVEVAGTTGPPIYLRVGRDLPLTDGALDLGAVPRLADLYGPVRLVCRPAGDAAPPLALSFVRLPTLRLEYVPDPDTPTAARAVRVEADGPLDGWTPGPDTEVRPAGGGVILRATRPAESPGVVAHLPGGRGTVRVRVPVSRGRLERGGAEPGGWQPLPLPAVSLAEVKINDRLRVELHGEPPTEGGQLVFACDGQPLHTGRADRRWGFAVELHRFCDAFGHNAGGVVRVRGCDGWQDVLPLAGRGRPEPAVMPADDSPITVAELRPINVARDVLGRPFVAAEWVAAEAGLAPLIARLDLPEAGAVHAQLVLRREHRTGGRAWPKDRIDRTLAPIPPGRDWDALAAECWYNLARSMSAPTEGAWQSCHHFADAVVRSGRPTGLAFAEALLLRGLARVMLRGRPADPPADLPPGFGPWVRAVGFLGRYVGTAWPRAADPAVGPLPDPPTVLRREDADLIRAALDLAAGRAVPVAGGVGFFAAGLLRARAARLAGDRAAAEAEYDSYSDAVRDVPGLFGAVVNERYESE